MVAGATSELYEREADLAVLEELLASALAGAGGAVLVEGEAGIGKTALLRRVRASTPARGMTTADARGAELEGRFPFGVARQLARTLMPAPEEPLAQLLAGDPRTAVNAPLVARALMDLVARSCDERPLLVAVDDAHWADDVSLAWLAQLARDAPDLRLALVVAARPGEPGAPAALRDLRAVGSLRTLRLGRLGRASVERIVCARVPDAEPGLAEACAGATGGNPFLLRALLDALVAEGAVAPDALRAPPSVVDGVMVRIGRLGPAAVAFAQAVAVLERDARVSEAAALAGVELDQAVAAADALRAVGILEGQQALSFAHPLLRAAVHDDIPPALRATRHRRAAGLLDGLGAPVQRVAAHLALAAPGGDREVVRMLRDAAEDAMRRGDAGSAAAMLSRALAEPPPASERHELMVALARAEALAAMPPAGVLDRVLHALDSAPDARAAARALVGFGVSAIRSGRAAEFLELARPLLTALPPDEHELRDQLETTLAFVAASDIELAGRFAERAAGVDADVAGVTASERDLLVPLATVQVLLGARRADVERLISRASPQRPEMQLFAAIALFAVEADEHCLALLDSATQQARLRGDLPMEHNALAYRAMLSLEAGDVREALADIAAARRAAAVSAAALGMSLALDAYAHLLSGDLEEARALAGAADLSTFPRGGTLALRAQCQLAAVTLASGAAAEAADAARAIGDRMQRAGVGGLWPAPWRSLLAAALTQLGEHAEARSLAEEEAAVALSIGAPRAEASARTTAALAARQPDVDELAGVVALTRRVRAPYQLARALLEHGAALRRVGERRGARASLEEALEVAASHGAGALAERARAELLATGARPRRTMRTGVDSLTATELRVARLAAGGLSNPQIAAALYVTRKTVEAHLANAYRKLDVHSRDALPQALGDAARSLGAVPAG